MADYLEYNIQFEDIEVQDLPPVGEVVIFVETKRETFIVGRMSGILKAASLGEFWDIKLARKFAEVL